MAIEIWRKIPIRKAANSDLRDKDLVNYLYDGGYLVSESIDTLIRKRTTGRYSLIDVLRYLYAKRAEFEYFNRERLILAVKELTGEDISMDIHHLVDEENIHFPSSLPYFLE